jgi:catechol 2,3-dioxygenase-like lactoylglutathione lyase family enzyme
MDMKLDVLVIPVSDVDRAKQFYAKLGWRLDADFAAGNDSRVIQFTPRDSSCSVIFGKNVTRNAPAREMPTGRIGMPGTWSQSRPARSCRNKRTS